VLRQRAREIAVATVLSDTFLLSGAFIVAVILRTRVLPIWAPRLGDIDPTNYSLLPLLIVPTTVFFLWQRGFYGSLRTKGNATIIVELITCFVLQALVGGALIFLFQLKGTSRALFALYLLIGALLLLTEKLFVRAAARRARSMGYNTRNIIVAGEGRRVSEVVKELEGNPDLGYRILGAVSDRPTEVPTDLRYLGHLRELQSIVQSNVVDAVLFTMPAQSLEGLADVILAIEEMGIRIHLRVDFLPTLLSRTVLENLGGLPILSLTSTPHGLAALTVKRCLDVGVASCGLIFLSPLIALCAAAIKVSSRGPVLFRQVRVGLNGREFLLYKFRSMLQNSDPVTLGSQIRSEVPGPVFKMKNDPRITRIGRWLRRFSLDEVPQLWNVLKGDMSLVGPRPPLPSEVAQYERWQRRRLSVRPGLTCIWQIRGRSEVPFERWMHMDMYYIDHWSIGMDLKILMQTVPAVIRARGAS
jgi:exopolysaccharide biosynthesis polyprenyl glycosylphosphotransferase